MESNKIKEVINKLNLLSKIWEKLPKYLIAAVLIIVPLFPKFPLFSVPGTYVAIRFEDLILLFLAFVVLAKIFQNPAKFFKDELTTAFTVFFLVNLISVLSGIFLTKTALVHIGLLNYFRRLEYLIPFFAALMLFTPKELKENLSFYLKILMIVIVIAFIYGLGQRYWALPIIITQNDQYSKGVALRWTAGSHINSTFAGHYDMAAFMVLVMPVLLSWFFMAKDKWEKISVLIASGSALWLLINSLSRISQLSYLVAVTVALFLSRKFKGWVVVIIISLIFIAQSPSLQARFNRVIDVFYKKIKVYSPVSFKVNFVAKAESTLPSLRPTNIKETPTPVPVFEDRSTSIRLKVEWPRAIRAFKINPLLGTGYSSITLATDNDFLRMLGETGLLGFSAFVLIFMKIGKIFISGIKNSFKMPYLEKAFVFGTIGGLTGTFIGATFIDLFEASKFAILMWFFVGYSVALIRANQK